MEKKLYQVAKLIRSKNAGPFILTFDILFDNEYSYLKVKDSSTLSVRNISFLFGVSESEITIYHYDPALAVKISMPRPTVSGDPLDTDVFGAQQYGPLVELPITL